MSADKTKILPVALNDEDRACLKVLAFEGGVGMTELIRVWIREKWALHVPGAGIAKALGNLVIKQSKSIGGVGVGSVVEAPSSGVSAPRIGVPVEYDEGGPIMGSCSKCGDKVPMSKLIAHPKLPNKKFCGDCVENMRNNQ